MTKTADRNLIVGLDIGTTKVAVLVGEVLPDGELNVIGMGSHASRGMDKGGVNDLDSVVKSLRRAVEEAEMMADCQISSVYLGLSGKHIDCRNETGMVPISDEEVTQEDVDNVIHTAKSVRLSDELRVLHVLPQEFAIDYQEGSKPGRPLRRADGGQGAPDHLPQRHGSQHREMRGEGGSAGGSADLLRTGVQLRRTDRRREGAGCLRGGHRWWHHGHVAVYRRCPASHQGDPYAGSTVTSDIAYAFGTPPLDAEAIKVRYGCALGKLGQQGRQY